MLTPWHVSWKGDPDALPLADRHYNRQKPGSPQFVPPGRSLVLLTAEADAVWVTSWPMFAQHRWVGAWVNTLFRREGGDRLASEMIVDAVAATRARWAEVPPLGMVTFINPGKVRAKRDPGYCYLQAGFRPDGHTKGGLLALRLAPADMPPPCAARERRGTLLGVAA